VEADAADLVVRDLPRLGRAVNGLHPDVQHPVRGRREPAQVLAGGRDARLRAGRVAEQHLQRDQRRLRGPGGFGCAAGGVDEARGGEQQGGEQQKQNEDDEARCSHYGAPSGVGPSGRVRAAV